MSDICAPYMCERTVTPRTVLLNWNGRVTSNANLVLMVCDYLRFFNSVISLKFFCAICLKRGDVSVVMYSRSSSAGVIFENRGMLEVIGY